VTKRSNLNSDFSDEISWGRVRAIFGNPSPPKTVWQRQFDHYDEELAELANTPYDEIDFGDLCLYYNDLAYCELQPDLFNYLFPVCLMHWHESLVNNEECTRFHFGVKRGNVFELMLTSPQQQAKVLAFMRDSFLQRLDHEQGFDCEGGKAYWWIYRFNSIGLVFPLIAGIWESWWSFDTPGKAIAALKYCSGLMNLGGGPYLWGNDGHIFDSGWRQENLEFLAATLTTEFVNKAVPAAVERLKDEPEWEQAKRLEADLFGYREWSCVQDLISARTKELPLLLSSTKEAKNWSW